ncbi:TonB-dependent receptor [Pseudohongiella spirulinae]|uniref:TonB-dependent outer membrane receptor n=1 Tax=Pseudohongiella spirulinae TaxID=1249552 RepID=A0A0S2KC38_9GAMM|nr:TonB-dependent receptor [Pseudohongiella spirulinae]ALO45710.1 TonB-dependent outer membrane receptor [Pseudohongiella spirulinae]
MTRRHLYVAILGILSMPVFAQSNNPGNESIEEILVLGADFSLQGTPSNATEGLVYEQQLDLRPISRTAELLEFIPGMIATQHSGEGKANQYFVRGFNLDHGTDFAINVDGLPVNMPSHGHGQGYADINFVIPELINSMRYRKGPYYASAGDFATAGTADFEYVDYLDGSEVNLTAGGHDYGRLFAGHSIAMQDGQLTIAGAATTYHGPWELDQNLSKRKGFLKYHRENARNIYSLTAMSYSNAWDATDQIPLRAVRNGQIGLWGNIDPTAGGDSERHSLSADWQHLSSDNGNWRLKAYIMEYELDLFSNFTYFDADPVRGDQFQQTDDRRVTGLTGDYSRNLQTLSVPTTLTMGFQHRYDDIHVGLHQSVARQRYASTRDDRVKQSLSSAYLSLNQTWSERLRTVAAVRTDHYRYDVDDLLGPNSGNGDDTLVSPKLNIIYTHSPALETFFSMGTGFHSNDARGATISSDPVSGEPVDPVDPLAKARGYEIGLRTAALPKTQLHLSAFSLRLSSELIYIGDEGTTEAVNASQREGLELGLLYTPLEWLLIDADISYTNARLRNSAPDNYIANAVRNTASFGIIVDDYQSTGWSGGIRMRYLGSAPLIEDNTVRTDSTFLVNAQVTRQLTPAVAVSLEVLNLFDSRDRDITYYYESRLPGESDAVADIHFHPAEPRSLRARLTATF